MHASDPPCISRVSSKDAAHSGTYGFEVTVSEAFTKNWHGLLSLPAFLVTDHERVYSLSFWAKASANPHPRPQVTFSTTRARSSRTSLIAC